MLKPLSTTLFKKLIRIKETWLGWYIQNFLSEIHLKYCYKMYDTINNSTIFILFLWVKHQFNKAQKKQWI